MGLERERERQTTAWAVESGWIRLLGRFADLYGAIFKRIYLDSKIQQSLGYISLKSASFALKMPFLSSSFFFNNWQ